MNQDVDQVKAYEIKTVKIIVERKADIGNRAAGLRTLESGLNDIFQTERLQSDVGIGQDIAYII